MLSEPKEQYRFMRLDGPSFDELLKTVKSRIAKRISISRRSHSQAAFIHYATPYGYCSYSEHLKCLFGQCLSFGRQTETEWKLRSTVDRNLHVCDIAEQIPASCD